MKTVLNGSHFGRSFLFQHGPFPRSPLIALYCRQTAGDQEAKLAVRALHVAKESPR